MNNLNQLENDKKLAKSAIIISFTNIALGIIIGICLLTSGFLMMTNLINNPGDDEEIIRQFLAENKGVFIVLSLSFLFIIILGITELILKILILIKSTKLTNRTILILLCVGLVIPICALVGYFLFSKDIDFRIEQLKNPPSYNQNEDNEEDKPEFYI